MPTQNVNLPPQLDSFVTELVRSGEFSNPSEVHQAALAAMAKERQERAQRMEQLRLEIQRGLDSGAPEEVANLESFLEDCAQEALNPGNRD